MLVFCACLSAVFWARGHAAPDSEPVRVLPIQQIRLRAGEIQDVYLNFGTDARPDVALEATLLKAEAWPEVAPRLTIIRDAFGETGTEAVLRYVPGGRVLWLRAAAERCTSPGSYDAVLQLSTTPAGAGSMRLPLRLAVPASSSCTIGRAQGLLIGLPTAVASFVVLASATHFRRLPAKALAPRIQALRWTDDGRLAAFGDSGIVEHRIAASLSLASRARTWLSANPLRFSLPGRAYREAYEITFNGPRVDFLTVSPLTPQRAQARWENRVGGHLFAQSDGKGGMVLRAVLDARGGLGQLRPATTFRESAAEVQLDLVSEPGPTGSSSRAAGVRLVRVQVRASGDRGAGEERLA